MRPSLDGKSENSLISITIACEHKANSFLDWLPQINKLYFGELSNDKSFPGENLSFFCKKCLWPENLLVWESSNGHVVSAVFSAMPTPFSVKAVDCGTTQNVMAFLKPIWALWNNWQKIIYVRLVRMFVAATTSQQLWTAWRSHQSLECLKVLWKLSAFFYVIHPVEQRTPKNWSLELRDSILWHKIYREKLVSYIVIHRENQRMDTY